MSLMRSSTAGLQAQKAEAARTELGKLLEEESARVAALQAELADTGNLRFQCIRLDAELAQTRTALSAVQVMRTFIPAAILHHMPSVACTAAWPGQSDTTQSSHSSCAG